jgi:hypothetical protein
MQDSSKARWPADLKLFAILSATWAFGLAGRAAFGMTPLTHAPLQAVIAGMKFYGDAARMVLAIEAAIFAAFAAGILLERRWGLILALCYLAEVVVSHFIFIIAYLDDLSQSLDVRIAAAEGPAVVLLLLYVWIRSRDILLSAD